MTATHDITAELHNWFFVGNFAYGEIHNDSKLRLPDGHIIRTSNGAIRDDILVTKNSTYKLIGEGTIL